MTLRFPSTATFKFGETAIDWSQLTDRRKQLMAEGEAHRSPGDLDIEQKLTMPVSLKFKQAPLGEVLGYLEKVTQVNMYIDAQGLKAEGVSIDEPVTIDLTRDIQLKSALTLLLQPLHLNYVIKRRSAEDHQRRPAARAGLHQELSGRRPGDPDSEFQPGRPAGNQRGLE